MDKISEKLHLLSINKCPNKNSVDIMEHLYTLYNYSKECDSIFETGVRGCVSSWAFLKGLIDSNKNGNKKILFMNDIDVCDINELLDCGKNFDIELKYEWKNNLLLDLAVNKYGDFKRTLGLEKDNWRGTQGFENKQEYAAYVSVINNDYRIEIIEIVSKNLSNLMTIYAQFQDNEK